MNVNLGTLEVTNEDRRFIKTIIEGTWHSPKYETRLATRDEVRNFVFSHILDILDNQKSYGELMALRERVRIDKWKKR